MFDAKSLIEMMMKGAGGQPSAQQQADTGLGGLGELLGKMMQGQGGAPAQSGGGLGDLLGKLGGAVQGSAPASQGGGQGGGLGDLLGKLGGAVGGGNSAASQGGGLGDILGKLGGASSQGGQGGGLEDMLRKLQQQVGAGGGQGGAGGGGLMDVLGQILGQASSGVKEGARKVDDMTGASGRMREATGNSPDEMMEKLKELVAQHQTGAMAAAAGVGATVLGTKTGRAMAGKAIKIGGLAMIGGLAYKALQNYQAGRPLITGADDVAAAPQGTGYETAAVTNESALLYIRGMIAAAAADGRIDAKEQQKLLGSVAQAGLGPHAQEFLNQELSNPASPAELAAQVKTEEEGVQLFTAARIAVDLHAEEEKAFLIELASQLNLDGALVQHIDAAARAQG